jgi:hypothetical protein
VRTRLADAIGAVIVLVSLFVLSAALFGLWVGLALRYVWVLS